MRVARKIWIAIGLLTSLLAAGALTIWISWPHIEKWVVGFHQKNVTRSLAAWAVEDAVITNDASSIHAANMIGYISSYYVPGPGYNGPSNVEARLETQRRESIKLLAESLQHYTGLDYGTNVKKWTDWAERRERELAPTNRIENRSQ